MVWWGLVRHRNGVVLFGVVLVLRSWLVFGLVAVMLRGLLRSIVMVPCANVTPGKGLVLNSSGKVPYGLVRSGLVMVW